MANGHLTEAETGILSGFLTSGQISGRMLPTEMSIGMDSMGPMRNPLTDYLFPGIADALGRFSTTLRDYGLMFVVATNGPDIEGIDILRSLEGSVAAYAVTQGGGKLIYRHPQTAQLEDKILADQDELARLKALEAAVSERPLMRALLGDRKSIDEHPPIRTRYDTNIVLTLPTAFAALNARLRAVGVDLQRELPGVNPENYVTRVLDYVRDQYVDVRGRLGMDNVAFVLTKAQNRRSYVMPKHIEGGVVELSKYSGAVIGSEKISLIPGFHPLRYELGKSLYVADKAVDRSGEDQPIIGTSESSMIIGSYAYDPQITPKPDDVQLINIRPVPYNGRTLNLGDVAVRLAVNVTMNDKPPRMDRVENVPVLHIGSGLKALEAITFFYQQLYK